MKQFLKTYELAIGIGLIIIPAWIIPFVGQHIWFPLALTMVIGILTCIDKLSD